ncbi:peptide chain release factor N(5)-glutamine methyltransferase [Lysinibacillus sp. LZ02]|uniref:peptide chain release factor N(5)-glutamine methyltransferase n=1 Tax=Lysinibacillus sp. LZ02 TaxID=3420668 RepID=UPI003D35A51D
MHKTVFEALNGASSFLVSNGRDENAARILLQHILKTNYSGLMIRTHETLTPEQFFTFKSYVEQHAKGRPVQYITGVEEFYGRTFQVDESVLIPRPETEELIVCAIEQGKKLFGDKEVTLADIGTGSGAIAITMKKEWAAAKVTATDISPTALATATKNADRLQAEIDFRLGDLTAPIAHEKWDIVLSNPPYIALDEAKDMSEVVLAHEPHTALFAEEEGLLLYRKLAENLPHLMNTPGFVAVEIGYKQGPAVKEMFQKAFPQATVEVVKDINGKDRIVFCKIVE